MNIFSKTFCRIYQSAFRIAMPLLPYRKPLIFTNVKECVPLFQKLNLNKTAIFVTKDANSNLLLASGNLQNVDVTQANLLNVYDIVCCDKLVVTEDAIKAIEEAYVG